MQLDSWPFLLDPCFISVSQNINKLQQQSTQNYIDRSKSCINYVYVCMLCWDVRFLYLESLEMKRKNVSLKTTFEMAILTENHWIHSNHVVKETSFHENKRNTNQRRWKKNIQTNTDTPWVLTDYKTTSINWINWK